jgi:hypothetical protein
MAQWPILSREASVEGYQCGPGSDPTVRGGAVGRPLSRAGPQPILDRIEFTLRFLSAADVEALDRFQKTEVFIGAIAFDFWERKRSRWMSVKLAGVILFKLEGDSDSWWTNIVLDEQPSY